MTKTISCLLCIYLLFGCGFTDKGVISQNPLGAEDVLAHAQVGISIKNCRTGKTVAAYNENTSLHPASVQKLITTASALELLSPDFRFETKLKYTGTIKNGVLSGNLIIEGGGDPSLGSEYLPDPLNFIQDWTKTLKQLDIHTIKGDIIASHGIFDATIPGRWVWEDIGNYYGAGAYGLSVYDNRYQIYFRSTKLGQKAQIAMVQPEIPGLKITSEAIGNRSKNDSAYIYGDPQNYQKVIRGSIPSDKMDFMIKGAIPEPPLFLARHLKGHLENAGIKIEGTALASTQNIPGNTAYLTVSPDLQELVRIINTNSNNQYAEHLIKMLSSNADSKTGMQGINAIKALWANNGVDISGLFMLDGSGLAPANAVNAELITDVLTYMQIKSNYGTIFQASLPKAGLEGSVSYFLKSSELKGKVWAKSGSMDRVKCFAGYLMKDDTPYAFAILVNQFNGHSYDVVKLIESYLETIYSQL